MGIISKEKMDAWPDIYGDPSWLYNDRFGMFIHWGVYSCSGQDNWNMQDEKMSPQVYRKYFNHFDPDLYDPKKWARTAKETGMKYAILTAKHSDGFCLWDTELTEYKATNTMAKRDLVREFVDAFRAEGLKVGLYYGLIDWDHPEFTVDALHPQKDDPEFREQSKSRDMNKYVDFMCGQLTELLTNYGKIDYLFLDFAYTYYPDKEDNKGRDEFQSERLEKLILELQPDILINDRCDLQRGIYNPEQYIPQEDVVCYGEPKIWDSCQTINGAWGYNRDNRNWLWDKENIGWKTPEMIVKMLADFVSKDGNLTLNVGPNARGEIDKQSLSILKEIGEWMRLHNRSIYGATKSPYKAPPDCRYTQKGNRLYLHIFSWPYKHLHLEGLAGKVEYAQFLNDGSEIKMMDIPLAAKYFPMMAENEGIPKVKEGDLTLQLPIDKPDVLVPVIELFLKEE